MRRHLSILAALLAFSCAVQGWMIARAVVPAQDAVRYVLMAQSYERDGLIVSLKSETEHPLYPLLMWLVHEAVELAGGDLGWAMCAQLASAAMLVVSLVPVYLLLLRLVGEAAATAGGLFYSVMTSVARLGADALADSTQLALVAAALYCTAHWLDGKHVSNIRSVWMFAAGALIGLAMLARPEATVLLPAIGLTIVWLQLTNSTRRPWLPTALGAAALVLATGAVQLAYSAITASFSRQSVAARVLGRDQSLETPAAPAPPAKSGWRLADGERMEFGIKDRTVSRRFHGHIKAAAEYCRELPEALQYWVGGLALIGLWLLRGRLTEPFARLAIVLFVVHSLAAVHLAAGLGYLSARHLTPLVLITLAPAAYAAVEAGNLIAHRCQFARYSWRWAVVALAVVACLPRSLAPLHATRLGHRQAGQWLAEQNTSPGGVLDTRGWTALYSGRPTWRYDAAKATYRRPDLAYVVVEERELRRDSPRARTLAHLLSGAAKRVAVFAGTEERQSEVVHVYRWFPERLTPSLQGLAAANP